ncbi:MAG: hypothetical protein IPJ81_18635 [Chitinophagaceae bacterium]|nr:hypothetical protein [Chitinophagaceae bacterium]
MWGENILVAPVLQKEIKERKVYLPGIGINYLLQLHHRQIEKFTRVV